MSQRMGVDLFSVRFNVIQFAYSKWTVKAHGIQVVKLCSLGEREFKVLKKLRDRFVGKLWGGRKGPGEAKTPLHKKIGLFKSPTRDVLSPGRDNPASGYEATGIWSTRDSIFWGWRRVAEYFRNLLDLDRAREAYALTAD